jgi:hypothetical protein
MRSTFVGPRERNRANAVLRIHVSASLDQETRAVNSPKEGSLVQGRVAHRVSVFHREEARKFSMLGGYLL